MRSLIKLNQSKTKFLQNLKNQFFKTLNMKQKNCFLKLKMNKIVHLQILKTLWCYLI